METIEPGGSAPTAPRPERTAWGPAPYLAVFGALCLVWGVWTIASWLADGPVQVTQFRDRDSVSWYAARAYEVVLVAMGIAMATIVIRRCVRERALSFDAKLCMAGLAAMWTDPTSNFVQPLFMYSSNFLNLATWCGHMPLVVNPDCGRMPQPVLFNAMIYTFGLLAFAMMINKAMRAVRRRWPGISTAKLLGLTMIGGVLVDVALEVPMYRLRLAAYPGAPDELSLFATEGMKYPLVEAVWAGVIIMGIAAVRFFKDDAGRTVVERGLERRSPRRRALVSLLALIGLVHVLTFTGNAGTVLLGPFADPYHRMPAYIVNEMCDAPGITGTRYGPCPQQGYKMPIRRLLVCR